MADQTYLSDLAGVRKVTDEGVEQTLYSHIEFGSGLDVAPDHINRRLVVTASAGGAGSDASDFKESVKVATTGNHALSGLANVDGVAISEGDRILVRAQSIGAQNGIYTASSGAWVRANDFDADSEVTAGALVPISEGTSFGNKLALLTTNDPITVGSTPLTFEIVAYASPLTTKGDLYTYSSTDARLPVGADGLALLADSGQAAGLAWGQVGTAGIADTAVTNAKLAADVNIEAILANGNDANGLSLVGLGGLALESGVINQTAGELQLQKAGVDRLCTDGSTTKLAAGTGGAINFFVGDPTVGANFRANVFDDTAGSGLYGLAISGDPVGTATLVVTSPSGSVTGRDLHVSASPGGTGGGSQDGGHLLLSGGTGTSGGADGDVIFPNDTAATGGAPQQFSPVVRWLAHGWDGSASDLTIEAALQLQPDGDDFDGSAKLKFLGRSGGSGSWDEIARLEYEAVDAGEGISLLLAGSPLGVFGSVAVGDAEGNSTVLGGGSNNSATNLAGHALVAGGNNAHANDLHGNVAFHTLTANWGDAGETQEGARIAFWGNAVQEPSVGNAILDNPTSGIWDFILSGKRVLRGEDWRIETTPDGTGFTHRYHEENRQGSADGISATTTDQTLGCSYDVTASGAFGAVVGRAVFVVIAIVDIREELVSGDAAMYILRQVFKTNASGTLTAVTAIEKLMEAEDDSAWDAYFDVTSGVIDVRVDVDDTNSCEANAIMKVMRFDHATAG